MKLHLKIVVKHRPGPSPGEWLDSSLVLRMRGPRKYILAVENVIRRALDRVATRSEKND